MPPPRVLFLPGAVLPAELGYAALLSALGPRVDGVAKDLELYATPEPPRDYGLESEVTGALREADARGWERFQPRRLLGRGSGSARVCGDSGRSGVEPCAPRASLGGNVGGERRGAGGLARARADRGASGRRVHGRLHALERQPDVTLPEPPPGDPPPWLANRPAGIRALLRAFRRGEIDRESLRGFDRPVYFALGGLTNQDQYGEIAERLGRVLPDFELEVFDERHHFDPPHRVEPERLAGSLAALWRRAEA